MQALENKIPPPLIAALFGLAMWGISLLSLSVELNITLRVTLLATILASALFFCIAGVVSFKQAATTVNPLKPDTASSLVNSGIYSISRNPMYLGFALMLTAWAVYLSSPWTLLVVPGFILYMNRFQILPEERALGKIFGSEFTRYQAKVRRWL